MHAVILWGIFIAGLIYFRNRPITRKTKGQQVQPTAVPQPVWWHSPKGEVVWPRQPWTEEQWEKAYRYSNCVVYMLVMLTFISFFFHSLFPYFQEFFLFFVALIGVSVFNFVVWFRLKRFQYRRDHPPFIR